MTPLPPSSRRQMRRKRLRAGYVRAQTPPDSWVFRTTLRRIFQVLSDNAIISYRLTVKSSYGDEGSEGSIPSLQPSSRVCGVAHRVCLDDPACNILRWKPIARGFDLPQCHDSDRRHHCSLGKASRDLGAGHSPGKSSRRTATAARLINWRSSSKKFRAVSNQRRLAKSYLEARLATSYGSSLLALTAGQMAAKTPIATALVIATATSEKSSLTGGI